MDKLRKIGRWTLRNLARLVLGVLVIVLAYRVVEVVRQTPEEVQAYSGPIHNEPGPGTVPIPPGRFIDPPTKDHSGLWVKNPFWYWSKRNEGKADQSSKEVTDNIKLLGIQPAPGGGYTARIMTQTPKWYKEGEQFESYRLQKIDAKNKTVEVYSNKLARTITLKMQPQ